MTNQLQRARLSIWVDAIYSTKAEIEMLDEKIKKATAELGEMGRRRASLVKYLDYAVLEAKSEDEKKDLSVSMMLSSHKPENTWGE